MFIAFLILSLFSGVVMAQIFQLDMFEAESDTRTRAENTKEWISTLADSQDRVRKGMFARLNTQGKELRDLKERMEILERNICLGASRQQSESLFQMHTP
jgi:hypothetical protein